MKKFTLLLALLTISLLGNAQSFNINLTTNVNNECEFFEDEDPSDPSNEILIGNEDCFQVCRGIKATYTLNDPQGGDSIYPMDSNRWSYFKRDEF
jgi:hypothetical protein